MTNASLDAKIFIPYTLAANEVKLNVGTVIPQSNIVKSTVTWTLYCSLKRIPRDHSKSALSKGCSHTLCQKKPKVNLTVSGDQFHPHCVHQGMRNSIYTVFAKHPRSTLDLLRTLGSQFASIGEQGRNPQKHNQYRG